MENSRAGDSSRDFRLFFLSTMVTLGIGAMWHCMRCSREATGSTATGSSYAYSDLPEACVCHVCGYEIENPGKHCPELGRCPNCGADRLWRLR
jgi:hypothetical protein